VRWTA
jgi:amino acid ABC transporter substrate-binding protein, PAAT family (TC 3.A.1.3.-)